MAKHLTDREIERVVGLLTGWKGALSWEALSDACLKAIGRSPSRQTLARATRVNLAFQTTKERLKRTAEGERASTPGSIDVAMQRIERLKAENDQLRVENAALLQQFVVWQYNASSHGLSQGRLNKPLTTTDMGTS
jgi:hypothetical protein